MTVAGVACIMKRFFPSVPSPVAPVPVAPRKDKHAPPTEGVHRVVVVDEPKERKRAKRQPLGATEKMRAHAVKYSEDPVFRDQSLVLRQEDGTLFCKACGVAVNCKKRWLVEQHCFGQNNKFEDWMALSMEAKQKGRHYTNLLALQATNAKSNALKKAVEAQRAKVWAESGGTQSARASTLPLEIPADRVKVLLTMWRCGIPLAKLDIPAFRKLVEEPHAALGGRSGSG